jgi:hypothetical protein
MATNKNNDITTAARGNNDPQVQGDNASLEHQHASHPTSKWAVIWTKHWLSNFLQVVVIIILVFHGYLLNRHWQAMTDSIDETKRNRELEYRAYVGMKSVKLVPRTNNPVIGDIIVAIANTGRTPAKITRVQAQLRDRESPIPDNPVYDTGDGFPSTAVLAPQVDIEISIAPIATSEADKVLAARNQQANKSQIALTNVPPPIIVTSKKFYAYGLIEYTDIFGKPHSTKFCVVNTPGTGSWVSCSNYNDAN